MLRRFAFAFPIVCLRLMAAGDGPVPDYVPPETGAVIGLDLRSAIDSPLARDLRATLFQNGSAAWNPASLFPGLDPLKDVDDVVIATTLKGDPPASLVICRGRFPVEEIEKGAIRYRGIPIRQLQGGGAVALLDPGTLLAGDGKELRAAIDRREAHAAGLSPALAQRVEQLRGRYAIWGAGTVPKTYHPPAGSPDGLGSLDRFDFGIGLNQGLELTATLHLGDDADAQKLTAALRLIEMMTKAQPDWSGARIETHVEDGTLSIALVVPEAALRKAIEQQSAAIAQSIAQAKAGAVSPAARAPKETQILTDKNGNSVQVTLPGKR
jgi:hypothetical protein